MAKTTTIATDTSIAARKDLGASAKAILNLLRWRQGDNPFCWLKLETIASEVGLDDSSVSRHLKRLINDGFITRHHATPGDGGQGWCSRYSVCSPLPAERKRLQKCTTAGCKSALVQKCNCTTAGCKSALVQKCNCTTAEMQPQSCKTASCTSAELQHNNTLYSTVKYNEEAPGGATPACAGVSNEMQQPRQWQKLTPAQVSELLAAVQVDPWPADSDRPAGLSDEQVAQICSSTRAMESFLLAGGRCGTMLQIAKGECEFNEHLMEFEALPAVAETCWCPLTRQGDWSDRADWGTASATPPMALAAMFAVAIAETRNVMRLPPLPDLPPIRALSAVFRDAQAEGAGDAVLDCMITLPHYEMRGVISDLISRQVAIDYGMLLDKSIMAAIREPGNWRCLAFAVEHNTELGAPLAEWGVWPHDFYRSQSGEIRQIDVDYNHFCGPDDTVVDAA